MKEKLPFNGIPETQIAIDAAIDAGKKIMEIYDTNFSITLKNDNEPLTEADIKSNKIIQDKISVFGYPILSEESLDDKNRLKHSKIWIIDPLDGTSDFVNKTGEFTIMISLVENNKPVLGVINCPSIGVLYLSQKDNGTFKFSNGVWTQVLVSKTSEISKCHAVGSRFHLSNKEKNFLQQLQITKFTSKGSSLKVTEISSGLADLYFTTTSKIKQWDTCASYCIITEAGGTMTDMFGNDLKYNIEKLNHENGLLVTNGLIHKKIVENYDKFLKEGNGD